MRSALIPIALLLLAGHASGISYITFDKAIGFKGAGRGGFGGKISLAFDSEGNIYVSDEENRLVQKLDRDGNPLLTIPPDPSSPDNPFNKPGDICVDGEGNIYVADTGAYPWDTDSSPPVYLFGPCVLVFSPEGELLRRVFIDKPEGLPKGVLPARAIVDERGRYALGVQPEGYDRKVYVAADAKGNLYVLDPKRHRIHKFNPEGKLIATFGRYGGGPGEMDDPSDIAVSPSGEVYVADKGNHRVIRFSAAGRYLGSFGGKGLGVGELLKPSYLCVTLNGDLLVKDAASWKRLIMSREELLSVMIQRIVFEGESRPEAFQALLREGGDLISLEEAGEKGEGKGEEDERLVRRSIAYSVVERIQRFSKDGRVRDEIIYRIDKRDEKLHDLSFAAIDPMGYIYLFDESDHVLRRYRVEGFSIKLENLDGLYTAGASDTSENFVEDYEDLNEKPDLDDRHDVLRAGHDLFLRYDLSPRADLSVRSIVRYSELGMRYVTPSRLEDSYTTDTSGVDNFLGLTLRKVINPNPFRYKELNVYFQHILGGSSGGLEAMFKEVNRQRSEVEGSSEGYLFGLDWDLLRNLNLRLEYQRLNPAYTSRNYTRRFYDVSGDLYEVMRSGNSSSILSGEIRVRF